MGSYANYEPIATKRSWKTQIMEMILQEASSLLGQDISIFMQICCGETRRGEDDSGVVRKGKTRSCFRGWDVIICKLGSLHPVQLAKLKNTHCENDFDELLWFCGTISKMKRIHYTFFINKIHYHADYDCLYFMSLYQIKFWKFASWRPVDVLCGGTMPVIWKIIPDGK